jgi:hypothetical protein
MRDPKGDALNKRRTTIAAACTAALLGIGVAVGITNANANIGASHFEGGDGNLIVNTAGNTDWLSPPPNFATSLDLPTGGGDNSFGNGTKEDNSNITVVSGSIPNNKADLKRQMIGSEIINGDLYLYLAATRASTSGTVNYDFEINQAAQPDLTTPGAKTLNRTVGDLLLSYDFQGGANKPTLTLHTWTGSAWNAGTALNGTNSEGDVNRVNIPANQGEPGDGGYVAFTFAEASVNLTQALGLPPNQCEHFAAFSTHSRASSAFTAEEKDFIAPASTHINNCATIVINKVTQNGDSNFGYATTGGIGTAGFSLSNGGTKTYTGVPLGASSVTENLTAAQVTAGWTLANLVCPVHTNGSTGTINGSTVTFSMTGGGEVDCTYTNHINLSPTIATTLSATAVNIGDPVHDSATLSGATAGAGGTVTYHAYAGANTCTGTDLLNSQVTVNNGSVPNSADFTPSAAGFYSFQAVYSGDGDNNPATSDCTTEQLLVRTNPAIATTLSATAISLGGTVHDSSTLSGATADAGGTVTYHAYAGANTCTGTDLLNSQVNVNNGSVPDSADFTPAASGTYSFQAVYSGDTKNNGASSVCSTEQLLVRATPGIDTTLSQVVIVVGNQASDSAALHNATTDAGGTVQYTVYTDSACSNVFADAGLKTVTNGVVPDSDLVTFNQSGTYYWQAHYSGDTNNDPATSACLSEILTVSKASPTASTAQNLIPNDSFSLSGGFGPTGSITFNLYAAGDASCSGSPVYTETVTVSGNGTYATSNTGSGAGMFTATVPGTYNWASSYSGDANNNPASSACGVEHFSFTNS